MILLWSSFEDIKYCCLDERCVDEDCSCNVQELTQRLGGGGNISLCPQPSFPLLEEGLSW
jgi:hypothetical protein